MSLVCDLHISFLCRSVAASPTHSYVYINIGIYAVKAYWIYSGFEFHFWMLFPLIRMLYNNYLNAPCQNVDLFYSLNRHSLKNNQCYCMKCLISGCEDSLSNNRQLDQWNVISLISSFFSRFIVLHITFLIYWEIANKSYSTGWISKLMKRTIVYYEAVNTIVTYECFIYAKRNVQCMSFTE